MLKVGLGVNNTAICSKFEFYKQVLKKHMDSPQGLSKGNNNKGAGDLRIWIYMFNKEGTPYNIGVGGIYPIYTELYRILNADWATENSLRGVFRTERKN